MGHQLCYMISIRRTDWESLIVVWFHYLLCMCTRTKHDNIVFWKNTEKGIEKGKDKYLLFFITSLYHLKAYKGARLNFFLIEYVRTKTP